MSNDMQTRIESAIKLLLLALLLLAGLLIWLAPRTRWLAERRVGEKLFLATHRTGAACAAAGLGALFAWPAQVLEWHLWELIVMPLVLVYAGWIVVWRRARSADLLDEKQDLDMACAGALAWALSIPALCVAFILHGAGLFDPALWYPYYLFFTLLVYSTAVLYRFRRG